jgi:polyisoprenoid-binding protein YceI
MRPSPRETDDGRMTESRVPSHQAPIPGNQVTVPPAGRYRIDQAHSAVTFSTRHLFGLAPVHGTLEFRDGTIDVAEPVAGSAVRAQVAAASFRTGNDQRDATVLSRSLLDAEAHPSLTFTSTALVREDREGREDNQDSEHQWRLRGEFTVRGVTRPVQARVITCTPATAGAFQLSAELLIDRYDFGITAYRGLAARRLTVRLDIRAERTDNS